LKIERESFFPKEQILDEIVGSSKDSRIDYVTFVGDGEPTLNRDLGWLIRKTKEVAGLPVAVITNGSLLWREDVRHDLADADVVVPTLDAGNEETFRKVNRAFRGITFEKMLQGQIDFRREYSGQYWIEVMLVADLNDSDEELRSIRRAVERIGSPDRVYIMTPIRPPAEPWVKAPAAERIVRAQEIIGRSITVADLETGQFGFYQFDNARDAILEICARHPLRLSQAETIAEKYFDKKVVERMLGDGSLSKVEYNGETYLLSWRFLRSRANSPN
jgi:wyosine [tRNA(Phe)-imidazoG37] synthetase (radical SAM superfamily)